MLFLRLPLPVHTPVLQWCSCRNTCGLAIVLPNLGFHLRSCSLQHSPQMLCPCLDMPLGWGVRCPLHNLVILPQTSVCCFWVPTTTLGQGVFVQVSALNNHSWAVLRAPAVLDPLGAQLELRPCLHCSIECKCYLFSVRRADFHLPVPTFFSFLEMLVLSRMA